jgi:hypothetical protein
MEPFLGFLYHSILDGDIHICGSYVLNETLIFRVSILIAGECILVRDLYLINDLVSGFMRDGQSNCK